MEQELRFGHDLGRLALLKKKFWADYEQLLRPFFSSVHGQKNRDTSPWDLPIMTLMIGRGRDLCRLHWDFAQKSEEHGHNGMI